MAIPSGSFAVQGMIPIIGTTLQCVMWSIWAMRILARKSRFVLWLITLVHGSSTATLIGISPRKFSESSMDAENNCRCSLRGFAVVFAEDIPDIQSTDVTSGERVCFC
jgi:hypothetical protein